MGLFSADFDFCGMDTVGRVGGTIVSSDHSQSVIVNWGTCIGAGVRREDPIGCTTIGFVTAASHALAASVTTA